MTGLAAVTAGGVMLILAGLVWAIGGLAGWSSPRRRPRPAGRRWSRRDLIGVVVGVVTFAISGWAMVGIAAGVCAVIVPDVWRDQRSKEVITRLEALAAWTRRLSEMMAAGSVQSLNAALIRSVALAPPAIAPQVQRLADRIQPQGTETALTLFAAEVDDPVADDIVAALLLRSRSGGSGLPAVLQDLVADVDLQVANRREVDAEREKPLSSVRMIVTLTGVIVVVMVLFGGSYMRPLDTLAGQAMLAIPTAMVLGSLVMVRQMTRPVLAPRFLDATTGSTRSPGAQSVTNPGGPVL